MPANASVAPRQRTRAINVDDAGAPRRPVAKITTAMRENAALYYIQNKACNAAKSAAEKARKLLYREMKDSDVSDFLLDIDVEGTGRVKTKVEIEQPEATYMDVRKLWTILNAANDPKGLESFLNTVTATKADVERVHGKNLSTRIEATKPGTENVKVKEVEA